MNPLPPLLLRNKRIRTYAIGIVGNYEAILREKVKKELLTIANQDSNRVFRVNRYDQLIKELQKRILGALRASNNLQQYCCVKVNNSTQVRNN